MTIIDNIDGVIIDINDRILAYKEAKSRVSFHNKEFNYAHRGKHYCQNAELIVSGDKIYINRKN